MIGRLVGIFFFFFGKERRYAPFLYTLFVCDGWHLPLGHDMKISTENSIPDHKKISQHE